MMTPEQMLAAFREAERKEIVTDLEDYAKCIANEEGEVCAECPASKACRQLAGEIGYDEFIENFDKLIRPLLKGQEMETKVVYSGDYGGFCLSKKATEMLYRLKGISLETIEEYNYLDICRHDKNLVKVVEELGDEANAGYSDLQIETITSDKYIIEEYDRIESVTTPDDIDWVSVKDK